MHTSAITVTTLHDTRVSGQPREAQGPRAIREEVAVLAARGFVRVKGKTFARRYDYAGESRLSLRFRNRETGKRVNLLFVMRGLRAANFLASLAA